MTGKPLEKPDLSWIPSPETFAKLDCPVEFFPIVEKLLIGSREIASPNMRASYDAHFGLRFFFEDKIGIHGLEELAKEVRLVLPNDAGELHLLWSKRQYSFDDGPLRCVFTLRTTPTTINEGELAEYVKILVVNGPSLFLHPSTVQLRLGEFEIELTEFEETSSLRKRHRDLGKDSIPTGEIRISKVDGGTASSEDFFEVANSLAKFLGFVKGTSVGIGHFVGFFNGDICFSELGFSKFDSFSAPKNWFEISEVRYLPELFNKFESILTSADGQILQGGIEFYRISNSIRETSIEMAIVSSHASLEALVPHILRTQGGWSNELLTSRTPFHSKLRACASLVGLVADPLEHAPRLIEKRRLLNNADGFELISLFRNRIVHQGKDFEFDGLELRVRTH